MKPMTLTRHIAALGLCVVLAGCVNTRPEHSSVGGTLQQAMANPLVETPVVIPRPKKPKPGSLWQPGSKEFFEDSRAHKVGDILTVVVAETAEAEVEANSETTRNHNGTSGINNILNMTSALTNRGIAAAANGLVDTESDREFTGEASTDREDTLNANIAAVVTQVLPNGYLVIQGRREVVVNYEMQVLGIQGIVRPEDINADNTIASTKIAEARITYAGKGIVDDAQTPSYGVRFLDKVMPF